ncbi:MAG: extracellular solute-binding protein [Hyphomicrobiaceae bacterium]
MANWTVEVWRFLRPSLTTVTVVCGLGCGLTSALADLPKNHGIAMHGFPKLEQDFTAFPYVNQAAPKGGTLVLGTVGTFDSLNPFIVKGVAPPNVRTYVYESLLARSADEPFTLYGHIAQFIQVPADRSAITFHLNPSARFSDGRPITTEDVAFTLDLLRRKGRPYMRSHYGKVSRMTTRSKHEIHFEFEGAEDREIPLIIGLMPILPKHATDPETFDKTSLDAPIGSGPYRITKVDPGHSVVFTRDPNYWAKELPVRRGLFNFDTIRFDFFRNSSVLFEAFKTGGVDYRVENDPARWIDSYNFAAVTSGKVKKYAFATGLPAGMTGLVFNTRRSKFADPKVRQAFMLAFDARRINEQMFHGRYLRSASFFARSGLASVGKPASDLERQFLQPFPDAVKPAVMDGSWRPPTAKDPRQQRANLKKSLALFRQAGYQLKGRKLVHTTTGRPLAAEFLVLTGEQERLALAYAADLKKLGVQTNIRQMESSQYWARLGTFDFDIIQWTYRASLSPGNEQIHRWSSKYADVPRSFNYPGVKNPAVDALITAMLEAKDRKPFEAAVRAFDRVLLSGDYVIPLFHDPKEWVAATSRLAFPERQPMLGVALDAWWFKQ